MPLPWPLPLPSMEPRGAVLVCVHSRSSHMHFQRFRRSYPSKYYMAVGQSSTSTFLAVKKYVMVIFFFFQCITLTCGYLHTRTWGTLQPPPK